MVQAHRFRTTGRKGRMDGDVVRYHALDDMWAPLGDDRPLTWTANESSLLYSPLFETVYSCSPIISIQVLCSITWSTLIFGIIPRYRPFLGFALRDSISLTCSVQRFSLELCCTWRVEVIVNLFVLIPPVGARCMLVAYFSCVSGRFTDGLRPALHALVVACFLSSHHCVHVQGPRGEAAVLLQHADQTVTVAPAVHIP